MVRYLEVHNCRECIHFEEDPQTMRDELWGKEVCTYFYKEIDDNQIKLLDGSGDIPDWCPLDGPNDL